MLFADVVFVAVAPWFTSLVPMLLALSPPEFFNSVIGMGKNMFVISQDIFEFFTIRISVRLSDRS